MHTMFKDTQNFFAMYEDKGSQGKNRMQALLGKDLDRERVYSHTSQSDFTLAHPKPVSGSRAQFCKPCTTNTSLASRYSVCSWPGVTLQVNLPSQAITSESKPQTASSHVTSTLSSRWHLATEGPNLGTCHLVTVKMVQAHHHIEHHHLEKSK